MDEYKPTNLYASIDLEEKFTVEYNLLEEFYVKKYLNIEFKSNINKDIYLKACISGG